MAPPPRYVLLELEARVAGRSVVEVEALADVRGHVGQVRVEDGTEDEAGRHHRHQRFGQRRQGRLQRGKAHGGEH